MHKVAQVVYHGTENRIHAGLIAELSKRRMQETAPSKEVLWMSNLDAIKINIIIFGGTG